MQCFCEGHNASSGLEPRERESCAEVSNARAYASGFCVVFTPPMAHKESPFLGSDMP